MRAKNTLLLLGGVLVLLVVVLTGCGSSSDSSSSSSGASSTSDSVEASAVPFTESIEKGLPTEYTEPDEADLTIGILNPLGSNETVKATVDALTAEVEQLGGTDISLDAHGDPNAQVNQAGQLIAQKVD